MKPENYVIDIVRRFLYIRDEVVTNPIEVYEVLSNISYIDEISLRRNKKGGLITGKIEDVPFKFYIESVCILHFIVMKSYDDYSDIIMKFYYLVKRTIFLYECSEYSESNICSNNIIYSCRIFDFREIINNGVLDFVVCTSRENYSVYILDFIKDKYLVAKN